MKKADKADGGSKGFVDFCSGMATLLIEWEGSCSGVLIKTVWVGGSYSYLYIYILPSNQNKSFNHKIPWRVCYWAMFGYM